MRPTALMLLIVAPLAACGDNQTTPPPLPYAPAAQTPPPCLANGDGTIERSELPLAIGTAAHYRVNPAGTTRQVSAWTAPADASGNATFDLSAGFPDDQLLTVTASSASGQWFSEHFAAASYALPYDPAGTLLAIFQESDASVALWGFASPQDGATSTFIAYDQPVPLWQFPVQLGQRKTVVVHARQAQFQGLSYASDDTYDIAVDAAGPLTLPDLTIDRVLRVRTTVTQVPAAGNPRTWIQYSFLGECLGEVARIVSKDGETNPAFQEAVDLRRLGL